MANIAKISSHHSTYNVPGCILGTTHTSFIFHNCVRWCHHHSTDLETQSQLAHCQRSTVIGPVCPQVCSSAFPCSALYGKRKLPFLAPTSADGQLDLANSRNRLEGEDEEEALIPSLSLLETASLAAAECALWLQLPPHRPLGFQLLQDSALGNEIQPGLQG